MMEESVDDLVVGGSPFWMCLSGGEMKATPAIGSPPS